MNFSSNFIFPQGDSLQINSNDFCISCEKDNLNKNSTVIENNSTKEKFTLHSFRISDAKEKLKHELDVLATINHPAIQMVYGYCFEENETLIKILSPTIQFPSLRELIQQEKMNNCSSTQKMNILFGIAAAMMYLQGNKFIKRNLSSQTVYIKENFEPLITDFQLAKFEKQTTIYPNNSKIQDPICFAPELLNNFDYNRKVDVFSYGTILYEILSLTFPTFLFEQPEKSQNSTNISIEECNQNSTQPFESQKKHHHHKSRYSRKELSAKIINGERPNIPENVPEPYRKLIKECWSSDCEKRPSFKDIVRTLLEPEFLLPDVDITEFKRYANTVISSTFLLNPPIDINISNDLELQERSVEIDLNEEEESLNEKVDEEEEETLNEKTKNEEEETLNEKINNEEEETINEKINQEEEETLNEKVNKEEETLNEKISKEEEALNEKVNKEEEEALNETVNKKEEEKNKNYKLIYTGDASEQHDYEIAVGEQKDNPIESLSLDLHQMESNPSFKQYLKVLKDAADSSNAGINEWKDYGVALYSINNQEYEKYLTKAANAGDSEVMRQLALISWNKTTNFHKNHKEARKWFDLSIKAGNIKALSDYGRLLSQKKRPNQNDLQLAEEYLIKASNPENHDHEAQNSSGILYEKKQNFEQAIHYYQLSYDQGNTNAACNLARMYYYGYGFPEPDLKKAAELYQVAYEKNNPIGMNNYAWFLTKGNGISKNFKKAADLYKQAADLGNSSAQFNYALMRERGEGIEQNDVEAFKYYQLSADNHNSNALNGLAFMYLKGKGTDMSIEKAYKCFQKAKYKSHVQAERYLEALCFQLQDEEGNIIPIPSNQKDINESNYTEDASSVEDQ